MTKPEGNPNPEARKAGQHLNGPGYSRFIIDSSFVIRHSSF
jgi:hypothetical protein